MANRIEKKLKPGKKTIAGLQKGRGWYCSVVLSPHIVPIADAGLV